MISAERTTDNGQQDYPERGDNAIPWRDYRRTYDGYTREEESQRSYRCPLCRDSGILHCLKDFLGARYVTVSVCPGDFRDGQEQPCPSAQRQFPKSRADDVAEFFPANWNPQFRADVRYRHRLWWEQVGQYR